MQGNRGKAAWNKRASRAVMHRRAGAKIDERSLDITASELKENSIQSCDCRVVI